MVYNMASQRSNCHDARLYVKFQEVLAHYVQNRVLPVLNGAQTAEQLLTTLAERHAVYTVVVRWMSRFFNYLDRHYVPHSRKEKLQSVAVIKFRGA